MTMMKDHDVYDYDIDDSLNNGYIEGSSIWFLSNGYKCCPRLQIRGAQLCKALCTTVHSAVHECAQCGAQLCTVLCTTVHNAVHNCTQSRAQLCTEPCTTVHNAVHICA